jgi:hypothetical protein
MGENCERDPTRCTCWFTWMFFTYANRDFERIERSARDRRDEELLDRETEEK